VSVDLAVQRTPERSSTKDVALPWWKEAPRGTPQVRRQDKRNLPCGNNRKANHTMPESQLPERGLIAIPFMEMKTLSNRQSFLCFTHP
jgi:hypothetical protein